LNFQSCLCVTPWVWICFFWIEGTLYEIATQIYCQDKILELFWQHWKLEITQISVRQEDNLQCTISVRVHHWPQLKWRSRWSSELKYSSMFWCWHEDNGVARPSRMVGGVKIFVQIYIKVWHDIILCTAVFVFAPQLGNDEFSTNTG